MPRASIIVGSFIRQNGQPVQGLVRFTPSRLWVVTDGITWACLAPEVRLDDQGRFGIMVTATDNDPVPFTYVISSPAGSFECYVPWRQKAYHLRELVREHCPRAGTKD